MKHSIVKSLAGLALAGSTSLAVAGSLGWTASTIEEVYTNGSLVLGVNFSVVSTVAVDGLGYFDADQNGFSADHLVNLYDSAGTLLASATVTSASTLQGLFRVASIAPLTLGPGDYRVVGASLSDAYLFGADIANLVVDPRLSKLGNAYSAGTSGDFLTAPTYVNDMPWGYFGPNISLGNGGTVPEPTALMLAALGLTSLGLARRRK